MNAPDPAIFECRKLVQPHGVLRAESPLARIFINRLVPLKTITPITAFPVAGALEKAFACHVAALDDCTPEDFAAITALMPELDPLCAEMFAKVRELAIPATHFEAVL